ncbi:MAG: class I SAM-dependent DNA methyltransferase, partial [Deltaproteobacteria bacterium]
MDKSQAKEQIENVFRKSFDLDSFKYFIRNVLNNYETRENKYYNKARLWKNFWPHINYYERIGKYTDPNGDELDILVVEVPSFAKLERARTTLRNLVVKHLATFGQKDYALAAFYAKEDLGENWRFSFIKIEHEAFRDDKGKVKTRTDFTPARRYSFLVGEHENTYTACKQLLPLLEKDYADPTIADIETAFSIEKVSDEFFQQYKDLYDKLFKHLANEPLFASDPGETRNKRIARFSKKLLGQIVFLYFLQKKGWLGVPKNEPWGRGDKRFLRNLFEEAENNERNFFNEYLQFLFYEALARNRRGSADPAYYERLDCKIPFLNGGLFEADYDWQENPLSIPNEIFHNDEKNKAGDIGTGILDVFDRYN